MMPTILERRAGASIHDDGRVCEEPPNGDSRSSSLYLPGQPESENYRLTTFRGFPQRSTAMPRRLAEAGFYYTGRSDVVKCFSCGRCVEAMTKDDDPRDRRYHHEDCDLIMGVDHGHGNIPTPTPMLLASFRNLLQTRNQNVDRRGEDIPENRPAQPPPSQPPEPQRSQPNPAAHGAASVSTARSRQPSQSEVDVRRSGQDIPPQIGNAAFPCQDPANRHMQNMRERVASFERERWPREAVIASPRDIAEAGFFYLGERDRVKCWYCDGGLENWEYDDDPWTEHAKWFPNCEFLLREKGPDFVFDVSRRFPNMRRPENPAPPRRSVTGAVRNVLPTRTTITGNTIVVPRGQSYIHYEPNQSLENITINSGGMRIQVRRTAGGNTTVVHRNRRARNRGHILQENQPRFVDPRQNAGRHEATVNEAMTNSPLITQARDMGFTDEVIRVVLLSKCEESGQIFGNLEDLLEALVQYQSEMERMGIQPGPEPPVGANEPSSSGASNEGAEARTPAEERLRNLEETRTCKMCHREQATVVLMPCAHLAICVGCSGRGVRICPVCRRMVTENIRSFIA